MPDVHAELSASGAKKWLNCAGAKALEKLMPDETSDYAEEGTLAHSLGEAKIKYELRQIRKPTYAKEVEKIKSNALYSEEMNEHTEGYKDYVIELVNFYKQKGDVLVEVEKRIDFSEYVPEGFGTGDICIISNDVLHIVDLKYGKGVKVDAEHNPQLELYALGALTEYSCIYDFKSVEMTIYQPRLDNISNWSISPEELILWGKNVVKPKAEMAFNETGPCVVGKHCDDGFCKARPICRKYNEHKLDLIEKFDFKEPKTLNNDEISEVLDIADSVSKWVNLVKNFALNKALEGEEIPGYKVVEGRANRQWGVSEEDVINSALDDGTLVIDDIAPRRLKTISELEKELGKAKFSELFKDFIVKPQGKPTLVDFTDKRPQFNSAVNDFKDFIEEE